MDGEYQRHQVGGAGAMDQSGAGARAGASMSNQVTAAAGEGQTFGTVLQSAKTQLYEVVNQVGPVAIACIVLAILVGLILRWIRRGAYAYTRKPDYSPDIPYRPVEWPEYDRETVSSARIRDDWDRWDGDRDGGSAWEDRRSFGEDERTRSWSGSQNDGRFGA